MTKAVEIPENFCGKDGDGKLHLWQGVDGELRCWKCGITREALALYNRYKGLKEEQT